MDAVVPMYGVLRLNTLKYITLIFIAKCIDMINLKTIFLIHNYTTEFTNFINLFNK